MKITYSLILGFCFLARVLGEVDAEPNLGMTYNSLAALVPKSLEQKEPDTWRHPKGYATYRWTCEGKASPGGIAVTHDNIVINYGYAFGYGWEKRMKITMPEHYEVVYSLFIAGFPNSKLTASHIQNIFETCRSTKKLYRIKDGNRVATFTWNPDGDSSPSDYDHFSFSVYPASDPVFSE